LYFGLDAVKLGEVLRRVPGLEKRFVYYLEAQGDIRPTRLPKARIARRDYSPDDARRITRLWDYYRRGYSLACARDLLDKETGQLAYVFLRVDPGRWAEALHLLRHSERVLEAAAVYGQSADLVAKLEASRPEDAFQVLHEAFDRGLLLGAPAIRRSEACRPRPRRSPGDASMLAYVLITVPAKQLSGVLEQLRGFDGITEASVIYGETDIIAKLEVDNQEQLDELIIGRIQGLPQVEATRTFIAVSSLRWQRDR
jgi:DNA-binding Lrp family transcriptional regulator